MADYISINGKNSLKRNNNQERNGSGGGDDAKKRRFHDPKLLPRIREYLENNRHKQYIDIEDMSFKLHTKYPEYNRRKLRQFRSIVEDAFERLQRKATDGDNNDVDHVKTESIKDDDSKNEVTGGTEIDSISSETAVVKIPSMNSVMTNLYDDKKDIEKTPFEKIQEKAANLLNSKVTNTTKTTIPSKTLETFLNSSTIENPNEDFVIDTKPATDISDLESKVPERSNSNRKRKSTTSLPPPTPTIAVTPPTVTFADFGGCDDTLRNICDLVFHLKHPEIFERLGVTPPRGFLLHGPPGCGKTLLAHAIAGEIRMPFIKIAATEIVSGVSGDSENKIREIFDRAAQSAPCVLFIDEIDAVTQKRENAQKDMERRIVAQLLISMDESDPRVLVIGATNRPDSLDPALRRAGRFDREIAIGIPDERSRIKILNVLTKDVRLAENVSITHLARQTPGYVGADLKSLIREAAVSAIDRTFRSLRNNSEITSTSELQHILEWLRSTDTPLSDSQLSTVEIEKNDFDVALKAIQPSSKREGFITVPDVTWDDVGALKDIREELDMAIMAPVNHPEKFQELGLTAPAGILLCGPPGCGKTLLAKAVANQAGINFISVKGPELLNMYVGESEKAVRQVFQRARHSAPCVIFFDELDALCPKRTSNGTDGGSSSRIVNQLLTEMDGIECRKNVFLMAATNRVDIIDPAIIRPGRLDKILFVDLPNASDREDILRAITKNGSKPQIESEVSFRNLAAEFDGYSGADLSALVREASVNAFKEYLTNRNKDPCKPVRLASRHFSLAKAKLRPSVNEVDKKKYDVMKRRYAASIANVNDPVSGLRFLPEMLVRVKETTEVLDFAGKEGVILLVENEGCQVKTGIEGETRTALIPSADLEPFTPGINEHAKLLTAYGRTDAGLVVREDEDDVTVHFKEGLDVVIQLDYLCTIKNSV